MAPQDLIDDLRSRINPAYAEQVGTESWDRRLYAEALKAQADEIERLRAEIDEIKQVEFPRRVQKVADVWRGKVDALRAENEKLRAEVEAMRRQVPVAWFEKSSDLDAWFLAYSCNPKAETKPLYLEPTG